MNDDYLKDSIQKQLKETFKDEDIKIALERISPLLNIVQERMKYSKFSDRFLKRSPIGGLELTNRPSKKGIINILVDLNNVNLGKEFKVNYDDILFLYDSKYDRCSSGKISNIIDKKDLKEINCLILEIEQLFSHGTNLYERFPYQYLSPETVAYVPTPDEILEIFRIKDVGDNLKIGVISDNNYNTFKINEISQLHYYPYNAISRHMAILGKTGVGKTIFIKNLIFELSKKEQTNLIIIDVEGDLIQLTEPVDLENDFSNYPEAKILFKNLNLSPMGLKNILKREEISFVVPDYFSHLTKEGFLQLYPWQSFGINSKNIEYGEELAFMIGSLTKQGKVALNILFQKFIESSTTSEFNFETFLLFLIQNGKKIGSNITWRFPGHLDTIKVHERTYESMVRQLNFLHNLKVFDQTVGLDYGQLLKKKVVYIYLPQVGGFEQVRILTLYRILKGISKKKFESSLKNNLKKSALKDTIFVLDEAHELLPTSPPVAIKDFYDLVNYEFSVIAREGRKKGLYLICASQSMKDLNEIVMKNANTKIFFRLTPEYISNLPAKTKNIVIDLPSQHALVRMPDYDPASNFLLRNFPPYFLHVDIKNAYYRLKERIDEVELLRKKYEKKHKKIPKQTDLLTNEKISIDQKFILEQIEDDKVIEELKDVELEEEEELFEEEFIEIKGPLEHHVSSFDGASALQLTAIKIKEYLTQIFKSEGIIYDHLDSFLISLSDALGNDKVIGICLQGPSGEGKSKLIKVLLDHICFGGGNTIESLNDQSTGEELFYKENLLIYPSIEQKDENDFEEKIIPPRFTYGVICKSILRKTYPILEGANRVNPKIYSGPLFLALDDRRVIFPGGKSIKAYEDWKIILLMDFESTDDVKYEMSLLPESLRDRIMFIDMPYVPISAVKKIIKNEFNNIKIDNKVIDILLKLRRETIKRSSLPKYLIEGDYEISLELEGKFNGLSIRSIIRILKSYVRTMNMSNTKEEALKASIKRNCKSVYRKIDSEHFDEFDKILEFSFAEILGENSL